MSKKIVKYFGVEISLRGFSYENDPDQKINYALGTSNKYHYLKNKIKVKKFKTKEEVDNFINSFKI